VVYETVLTSSSTFFRSALQKKWKEWQDRKINLSEDDGEMFYHYIQWLYTEAISIFYDGTPQDLPARRLVVDFCVSGYSSKSLTAGDDQLCAEFLLDLACALMDRRG